MVAAKSPAETSLSRSQIIGVFAAAVIVSVALGQVSWGGNLIYPFRLLATWAHELGHGIGALITGNRFESLEVYRSLGGVALIGGADGVSQVIVSVLGLVGPALLGAIVMVFGSRTTTAPYILSVLAGIITVSTLIWVRNLFGFFALLAIAAALAVVARFAPPLARVALAQIVAVQMALSSWSSRDYLFIKGFERDGQYLASDTQKIAEEWFLPYWFWGGLTGLLSIAILVWAFWFAWLRPMANAAGDASFGGNS